MAVKTDLDLLELRIAKLLRWGVLFSAALILVGWILSSPGQMSLDEHREFKAVPITEQIQTLRESFSAGPAFSLLGLGLLVLLPVIRVALTAILFYSRKEWVLAATASFVLVCLGLAFSLGWNL